ncbi:MAG TPA: threonine/serine dehydratase [Gemmatimonadaceae bacterium]|nr:threonine/serine dehydratase [Gemmatimonadaceae bacterium]
MATAPTTAGTPGHAAIECISMNEVYEAASTIRDVVRRTPLLPNEPLSELCGVRVWFKPENLQRGGAFKLRGAYNYMAHLPGAKRTRGVIAPSSGNHAQAVALSAQLFKVPATVVMPETVTPAKRAGAERLGARVELAGTTTKHRLDRALEIAERDGLTLIPPYDDLTIIAGQGTVGLEIAEDLDSLGTVLVPVGGGGLSAGVAAAIKQLRPKVKVIGVEPEGAPKLARALLAGEPVTLDGTSSIADGLLAVRIGTINLAHHQAFVDEVVGISDSAIKDAMRFLLDRAKLVVEPSGAITVAALMTGAAPLKKDTVAILSGGNIEWAGLKALLGDE